MTEIRCNSNDPLFDKTNMLKKEFPSDWRRIRYFTLLIVQSAPFQGEEMAILEQQVCEIIKNAIKHGNKCDLTKKITVYYSFSSSHAHLIVEDEGEGFKELEKWNEFNKNRRRALEANDLKVLADYVSFKTEESASDDGGNALFAALEFWNEGIAFNEKRNSIAMYKTYPQK